MCLDKIPYDTTGTLSIVGYNTLNDTVAFWEMENFTFTNTNTTIQASFISVGKIVIQVTIHMPGVTIIIGIMDTTDSIGDENGGLTITEIMYAANDSEYIEALQECLGMTTTMQPAIHGHAAMIANSPRLD